MRISRDRMADWDSVNRGTKLSALIRLRDYTGMNSQDAKLRLWLPDVAKQALEEVCERAEISMTVYLTEYFSMYLYGWHELLRMRETKTGLYEPLMIRYCMEGVAQETQPNLGKNIFALKMFIPIKLKADLLQLAERSAMTLGEFARGLICAHLFGREYGPGKLKDWTDEDETMARQWEESGAVT